MARPLARAPRPRRLQRLRDRDARLSDSGATRRGRGGPRKLVRWVSRPHAGDPVLTHQIVEKATTQRPDGTHELPRFPSAGNPDASLTPRR